MCLLTSLGGQNYKVHNVLLNLLLGAQALCTRKTNFSSLDFSTGKTQLVLFDWSNNNGAIDMKVDGPVLEEKSSFKMLVLTFSSKLDWGSYIKLPLRKLEPWFVLLSFFLLRVLCSYLHKSTFWSYMEYCCHVWAGAPSCYLELLDKLQNMDMTDCWS